MLSGRNYLLFRRILFSLQRDVNYSNCDGIYHAINISARNYFMEQLLLILHWLVMRNLFPGNWGNLVAELNQRTAKLKDVQPVVADNVAFLM